MIGSAEMIDGFGDLDIGQGLDVRPFIKGSATTTDSAGTDMSGTGGLDVFWKLPPSLTLALTINNDFAETEVDQRQINFGRFPLFFPERRDFFLQDAGIFEFAGLEGNGIPYFSRRIGRLDGEVLKLDGGLKLTGRQGPLSFGGLHVRIPAEGLAPPICLQRRLPARDDDQRAQHANSKPRRHGHALGAARRALPHVGHRHRHGGWLGQARGRAEPLGVPWVS